MKHRHIALLITVGVLAPVCAAAQATNTTASPRTTWGDPDLQGVWDYATITPMQRQEKYGDREFLTEEEVAELERGAVERDRAADAAPARRAEAGANVGAYNRFWMDYGTQVAEDRRTSRLIDPPNGRFPALTPAGEAMAKSRTGFGAEMPSDDYADLGWGDRCLAIHGLPINPLPYNSLVQLFQTPDPERLAVSGHDAVRFVDHSELTGRDQLDSLARLDDRACFGCERLVFRSRFADGDEGCRLGQAVDVGHVPSQFSLDSLNRRGGGRSPGGDDPDTSRSGATVFGRGMGQADQHRRRRTEHRDRLVTD